jgi:hypothetical protein
MTEINIMRGIQMAMTNLGHRVFRNNVGMLPDKNGQMVKFGLCNPGGSDLIGISKDGRFLAIEVKIQGKSPTKEQSNFIIMVQKLGGIAFVAHSVEEAVKEICGKCD